MFSLGIDDATRSSRFSEVLLTAMLGLFPAALMAAPVINSGGIVNAASYGVPASATPAGGSIVSLFGTGLATSTVTASTLPLPLALGSTTVAVNRIAAPLFYVSPTQINFQLPWQGCCADLIRSVIVTVNNEESNAVEITVSAFGPALFSVNAQGTGQGAIQIANTAIFAAPVGSVAGAISRPVQRGEDITIYAIGLGPVTATPANGAAAQSDPVSETLNMPLVTIGGFVTIPTFSGLVPGLVGLYQVNVKVPGTAPSGNAIPVTISTFGLPASNTVTMAIQ